MNDAGEYRTRSVSPACAAKTHANGPASSGAGSLINETRGFSAPGRSRFVQKELK